MTSAATTVLLVDDNRDLAENLEEILECEGIAVDVAHDGSMALAMLAARDYGLVITDVRMPGMSGIAVLEAIRERWPRIPVIVMSAFTNDQQTRAASAAGALQVMAKPVDIARILELVERVVGPSASILVVEDDPALCGNLCEVLLELTGIVPHATASLAGAERLASAVDFRAAIIDARLPDGNGIAFGRALRERRGESLAIFYITGYAAELGPELAALDRASPGVKLIEKPFSPQVLLALVQGVVGS